MAIINISSQLADISSIYKDSASASTISAMILGGVGMGKTCALATAPKPHVIACFDPGGMKSINPEIAEGGIYPILYDVDDKDKPFAFKNWMDTFNKQVVDGFFNEIASYSIDSFTYWLNAALMFEKGEAEIAGIKRYRGLPALDDYRLCTLQLVQMLQKIMTLPCNFFLTAHVMKDKDELTGKYISSIVANPYSQKLVPAAFDEVYLMCVESKKPMNERYKFLTDIDGMYECRSRLATKMHLLDKYEPANIRHILKKVNYPYADKQVV